MWSSFHKRFFVPVDIRESKGGPSRQELQKIKPKRKFLFKRRRKKNKRGAAAARNQNNKMNSQQVMDETRRDKPAALGASIGETYASLLNENPDGVEEDALRRAIELSMLDWALVFRKPSSSTTAATSNNSDAAPAARITTTHQILGVHMNATPTEIKAAYRKKARETHPDKGGKPGDFELVARAYRILLHGGSSSAQIDDDGYEVNSKDAKRTIKNVQDLDGELRDHQMLVNELFENHGADLSSIVSKMNRALDEMGLYPKDAGATNLNEKKEKIRNSCFYLSLAASYLHGIGALLSMGDKGDSAEYENEALIGETALDLKRTIEAAVVRVHPEWAAQGKVGEEVQAFSDFLVYVLDSPTILSDWAVAVFDTVSGFVDVYKGKDYREDHIDEASARSNTICLRFVPGHYQPLYPLEPERRPSLETLLECLDTNEVFYVITDGAA